MKLIRIRLFFVAAFVLSSLTAVAQTVNYTGSFQFSTGYYYFEDFTNSFYFSNGVSVQNGIMTMSLNIPYVYQSSPWVSYTDFGGIPTGGTQQGEVKRTGRQGGPGQGWGNGKIALTDTTSYKQSGFSDPTIAASFTILTDRYHRTIVSLNSQVKIPVASPSKGFGTGAWDAGVGVSVSKGIFYKMMIFANSMYWRLGDMDELELRDAVSYSAGLGLFLNGDSVMFSGSLSGITKIADEFDAPVSLHVRVGVKLNERVYLNGNLSTGLSEASPDFSCGLGWTIRL